MGDEIQYNGEVMPLVYMCPYDLLQRFLKVAYKLRLPSELAFVHLLFHVSCLQKCIGDPVSVLTLSSLSVHEELFYEEVQVKILDC